MSFELLRKRLKELREKRMRELNYTAPEIPGMDDVYQPVNLIETYHPPEVDVPDEQAPATSTATQPIIESEDDVVNRSAIPTANTAAKTTANSASGSKVKVDPKTGTNGAKTIDDITVKSPQFGEEGMGHDDLVDAYNAGLNGIDLDRETRANAAAGGYLDSIEAMYNAGLQDATLSKNVDGFNQENVDNTKNSSYDLSTEAARQEQFSQNSAVDNPVNLGYTAGDTTGNDNSRTDVTDIDIPDMGFSKYGDINWDLDYNYIEDMMFLNGAANSADPSVQMAYQYITNLENRGRKIPAEVMEAFKSFMENLSSSSNNANPKNDPTVHNLETQTMRDDQIKRSQGIAIGNVGTNNYDYDEIKERNDNFGNFHTPTDLFPNTTRAFGADVSSKDGKHIGLDIGNKNNTNLNLYSIYDGDVVYVHDNGNAGGKGGNGLTVIIRHENKITGKVFFSAYMHLDSNSVKKGDHVDSGQPIGIMGNSGGHVNKEGKNDMGVHLHIMVFTCSDVEKYSHDPLGYASNGKSYKGTNDVTYYFYDPEEVINTGGKILWD
ncbi:MAG TPA: M23 family metallopeptidase [Oscillospiraceae bacterium]|nr:M23 family metallopeptidase [Oscillospiraceae bacterium]HPK35483.1 M23 family metallopeptidase [Oscillospiraceae bacterium]HPR75207.1 M23 family metallopeptidase [Oscillospiraceae bacterium]